MYARSRMKKLIWIVLILAVAAVAYWLISPLFIERRVAEDMPVVTGKEGEAVILSRGAFVGLSAHNAEGAVSLLKVGEEYYVRLEEGFRVTNGPDLFVHFGKDGKYVAEARLGALKGNVGSQNYLVPAGLRPSDYNEVWIWCRFFSVPFGKAELAAV